MILLEQRQVVTAEVSVNGRRRRTRIVRPNQVRPNQVRPSQVRPSQVRPSQVRPSQVQGGSAPEFLDEVPFGAFGRIQRGSVVQPKPECSAELVRWLALQPETDEAALRQRAEAEHSGWFEPWDTLRLFDASLRLPQDEVAVHLIKDPLFLPDNPPPRVEERWTQAALMYPQSVGWYAEPFFDHPDSPEAKALTSADLRSLIDDQ